MSVHRDIEARSCDNSCDERTITVTYSECVCSLRYPAYNAHAPKCHLWSSRLHNIFPTARFSEKKITNKKFVFSFSLQTLSETFLIP